MPVKRRGFFFQYFDRIVCGVVALGILAAVLYAARRAGTVNRVASPSDVVENLRVIEVKMRQGGAAVPPPKVDYAVMVTDRLQSYSPPRPLKGDPFYPPLPKALPNVRIGLNQEAVLDFKAPLDKGSVKVERAKAGGDEDLVDVIGHPEDDDYTRVRIRSRDKEGEVFVVGEAGGLKHELKVYVDPKVGKVAYAPKEIDARPGLGVVVLRIAPDPRNDDDEVEVEGYEVWRRDWADPLGDYESLETANVGAGVAGVGAVGAARFAAAQRGLATRARAGVRTGLEGAIEWQDLEVEAGQRYSYKVRTVGLNTYPKESDFTASAFVEVPPMVDFRVTGSGPDTLGIEVAEFSSAGGVSQGKFWVHSGDEIGGVAQNARTGQVNNLLTDCVLVDFHRNVIQPGRGLISDRAIYIDAEGNLQEAWRWRTGTESTFWELVKQGGAGRARTGPFMGPTGPTEPVFGPGGLPRGARPTGGRRGG